MNHLHFKNKNILNNYMITSLDTLTNIGRVAEVLREF